ncbi:flagellar biosynthesis protein FlhB [Jannaschia sp. R86511]|uniref:EscU/YscU/HrcU family type III secretion system export apparatus switch protein n=1 Tax=Jannaschia sp. R86511 TaxID=3093853 RepID=UPI0036D383E3
MSGGKDSGQEKTEAPSPRKLKEAKDQGNSPRTQDLSSWASIAAMAVTAPAVLAAAHRELAGVLARAAAMIEDPDPAVAMDILVDATGAAMLLLVPLVGAAVVASIAAFALQGGIHFAWPKLKPDLKRLDPFKGLKRILGPMTWWEGAKTLIKATALVLVAWWAVSRMMPALMGSGALTLGGTVDTLMTSLALLIQVSVVVGVVMAAADFAVQKRKSMKDLKMTRQEVLDENKSTEGNPLMKQARRSKHLQMSRNRMMSAVAQADVVVVNPTHYAVALRYEAGAGPPQVLAKGVDGVARRIRERAAEHRIPMVEDVPLARALHAGCEVGDEIPGELFEAVAHVLAFVMSLRVRGSATGLHRDSRRTGDVPDGDTLRRARRTRRRRAPAAAGTGSGTGSVPGSGPGPVVPRQHVPGRRQDGHGAATGGSTTPEEVL